MKFSKHLKSLQLVLLVAGWWPLKTKYHCFNKVYEFYSLITFTYFVCFSLSITINIPYAYQEGPRIFRETLMMSFMLYLGIFLKLLICRGKKIQDLIQECLEKENLMLENADASVKKIYEKLTQKANKKCIYYGLVEFWMGIIFAIFGYFELIPQEQERSNNATLLIINDKQSRLVLTKMPFDTKVHYLLDYVISFFGAFHCSLYNAATQTMFLALMAFTVTQLKVLQHFCKNLKMHARMKGLAASRDDVDYQIMRMLIIEHKTIIKFTEKLDENIKYVAFVDFLTTSVQVAAALVAFVTTLQLYYLTYLPFQLVPICSTYWEANEIKLESMQVSQALYESDWINKSLKVKKSLLIMMIRAQKPLQISIGPFYKMSTDTLKTTLKTAYGYCSVFVKTNE